MIRLEAVYAGRMRLQGDYRMLRYRPHCAKMVLFLQYWIERRSVSNACAKPITVARYFEHDKYSLQPALWREMKFGGRNGPSSTEEQIWKVHFSEAGVR